MWIQVPSHEEYGLVSVRGHRHWFIVCWIIGENRVGVGRVLFTNANSWASFQIPASESGGRIGEFAFYKSLLMIAEYIEV